jgi:hypothetical protein
VTHHPHHCHDCDQPWADHTTSRTGAYICLMSPTTDLDKALQHIRNIRQQLRGDT